MREADLIEAVANLIRQIPDPSVAAVTVIRFIRSSRVRQKGTPSNPKGDMLLMFPCVGSQKVWNFTTGERDRMSGHYPNLDVMKEAHKALAWIEGNPTKRKTAGGMQRFLASWFNREVNSTRKTSRREREAVNTEAVNKTTATLDKLKTCTFHLKNPSKRPPQLEEVYWCVLCTRYIGSRQ